MSLLQCIRDKLCVLFQNVLGNVQEFATVHQYVADKEDNADYVNAEGCLN